ncbi:MAG: hypothetical protein AAB583_07055, partial [Patescibacteria group bacterium]
MAHLKQNTGQIRAGLRQFILELSPLYYLPFSLWTRGGGHSLLFLFCYFHLSLPLERIPLSTNIFIITCLLSIKSDIL